MGTDFCPLYFFIMNTIRVGCKDIVDYMKEYNFYRLYARNLLQAPTQCKYKKSLKEKQNLLRKLLGAYGPSSLTDNLVWKCTPEGYDFWEERHYWMCDAFYEVELKYKMIERCYEKTGKSRLQG